MLSSFWQYHRNIEINITDNRHFAFIYFTGVTSLQLIWSTEQEPTIYVTDSHLKKWEFTIKLDGSDDQLIFLLYISAWTYMYNL